jgi:urease accessory protein UreF
MDLPTLLQETRTESIDAALAGLSRATLPHYSASSGDKNRKRLEKLYDLAQECVVIHSLIPITEYSRELARERHKDGFDLQEVHTAFNVLEEVIWRTITARLTPRQYPEAFGLASTVLGAGKQALAIEYVALASANQEMHSLDLSALFQGTT